MSKNPYVKKIHDYQGLIYPYGSEPEDFKATSFFQKKEFVVDLGCGAGNHIVAQAARNPEVAHIGFELRFKRLVLSANKALRAGLENVRLVQAKVEEIADWLDPETLNAAYSNFPDPWPKKRHRKHRFLNQQTFNVVHKLLKKDGFFQLKTDDSDYFFEVKEMTEESPIFSISRYTEDLCQSEFFDPGVMSEFEGLFISKNMPVYMLRAEKIEKEASIT